MGDTSGTDFRKKAMDGSFYEKDSPSGKRYRRNGQKVKKRDDLGDTFNRDATAAAPLIANDSFAVMSVGNQIDMYAALYVEVQMNASAACVPVFMDTIAGSNSSLIDDATWSIYTDIFFTGEQVMGPFSQG